MRSKRQDYEFEVFAGSKPLAWAWLATVAVLGGALGGTLVSYQAWQASWNQGVAASALAAVACIGTWTTDFRDDLPKIDVPMLVLHGDADQVLPLDKTAKRLPGLINDVQLTVVEGGPHAIPWTHAGQVNTALLDFLRR